jgi:hypothetical protein
MKLLLTAIFFFTCSSLFASLVLEPRFGETLILSKDSSTFSDYGGRASLGIGKVAVGIDYSLAKFKDKTTSLTTKYSDQFSRKQMGVFFSFTLGQVPAGKTGGSRLSKLVPQSYNARRIWLGYIMDVQDKITSTGGFYQPNQILKGKGFELGMSNKIFSIFSGYIAARKITLDNLQSTTGVTTSLTGANIQNIYNFEVGIGIPLALFN